MNWHFCLKWDLCKLKARREKGVFRAAHPHTPFLGQCPPGYFCLRLPPIIIIPILYKNTQFCSNWMLFYHILLKIHPISVNWVPLSVKKTPDYYTKILEKAPPKAGTYVYYVNVMFLRRWKTLHFADRSTSRQMHASGQVAGSWNQVNPRASRLIHGCLSPC